ncbi:MAG: hypothetical protein KF684_01995 [Phycisphaeraceae bacterium]|nr:hypothetical protein [Phycisphaeraceae bacterium]
MSSTIPDHVVPRPVEPLPELAHAKSRQTLAEKLIAAFGLAESAANAISNAVVDPAAVRKEIGEPTDPQTEEILVPGGSLLGIRTTVWARRIMPDPRNPRIGPSRRHPFAVEPGKGSEASRFRPVPEPRSPQGREDKAELEVEIESRDHLVWASNQAAGFILAENDWRESIKSQGVMEAVWLVATTYIHADGSEPATTLVTAEGSSRATAEHDVLGVVSADVPYDSSDTKFRADIRKLNDVLESGATDEQLAALRCQRMPALIIVGFRKHKHSTTTFPTAIKSLVALRHVDPPKPWGEGPENESLADEVLDELQRRGLVSSNERAYLAGACTREEARAARLPDDPASRAARIVRLFTTSDPRVQGAIRVAVTSQSTRKRITPKLMNALATALILRALNEEDASKADQVRRYMRHAFGKSAHHQTWENTGRSNDELAAAAIQEVEDSIARGEDGDTGPASLELAVRAAYPLLVQGKLNADRGTANNDQPDRRTPGEILDRMRQTVQGVRQLAQALNDFRVGVPIRAVDERGQVKPNSDGTGEQYVNDIYLRDEFPSRGKVRARRSASTPGEALQAALSVLGEAFDQLEVSHRAVGQVFGDDGRFLVDTEGVDYHVCGKWKKVIEQLNEDLVVWSRQFRKRYGTSAPATKVDDLDSEPGDPEELGAEADAAYDGSYSGWEPKPSADQNAQH